METLNPAFPVRHSSLCLDIEGHKTDIIISSYEDRILVMATQIGSMGTILQARPGYVLSTLLFPSLIPLYIYLLKEGGVSVDPTYSVSVVLGKRDEPMLIACARQLIEHISNSGSSKTLVLSLGLRDHSSRVLKGIVSAVTEKLAEVI